MLEFINSDIIGRILPAALLMMGLFFIIYMRGLPFLKPAAILSPFLRKELKKDGISPRSALWLALGGVLGVGNIVGVSAAIFYGGAGAVFWMCTTACVASVLKYAETILALSRRKSTAGYIKDALGERGLARAGKYLSIIFAILCLCNSLSMGCLIQINAVTGVCESILGANPTFIGIICAILVIAVSSGGLRRISDVTNKIVPFMSVLFLALSITALILKADRLPNVIKDILSSAFEFKSEGILGGIGGFFISKGVRLGITRGLISNEAGAGTSPMAHSASSNDSPAEQGFLSILEVLIDTVLLCTLTALVILASYHEVEHFGENSVMMTLAAYSSAIGKWSEPILCGLILLFGLATVFCQCFYAQSCLSVITNRKAARVILVIIYGAAAFVASRTPPGKIWDLADLSIGLMTLINLFVLFLERKRIKKETLCYFNKDR